MRKDKVSSSLPQQRERGECKISFNYIKYAKRLAANVNAKWSERDKASDMDECVCVNVYVTLNRKLRFHILHAAQQETNT